MDSEKALLFGAMAAIILVLIWSLYVYSVSPDVFGSEYQVALNAENPIDKCATPSGYTDESWGEHMSHHPDRYAECLET
jgi:hypothetical protein